MPCDRLYVCIEFSELVMIHNKIERRAQKSTDEEYTLGDKTVFNIFIRDGAHTYTITLNGCVPFV